MIWAEKKKSNYTMTIISCCSDGPIPSSWFSGKFGDLKPNFIFLYYKALWFLCATTHKGDYTILSGDYSLYFMILRRRYQMRFAMIWRWNRQRLVIAISISAAKNYVKNLRVWSVISWFWCPTLKIIFNWYWREHGYLGWKMGGWKMATINIGSSMGKGASRASVEINKVGLNSAHDLFL